MAHQSASSCLVVAAMVSSIAGAAVTTTVVDVPTRGATQRFLYVRPEAPVANIVFLPGDTGILGIANDGSMPTMAGRCAPFARNRDAFAARGFAVALVDQTSDFKIRQYADIREVVRYMRGRDNVPTWIVGRQRIDNGGAGLRGRTSAGRAAGRHHLLAMAARRLAGRAGEAPDAGGLPCGGRAGRRRSSIRCSMP